MLGSLLEKKLKELKGKFILVVMDDGMAFRGKLLDLDKNTLILRDVYETIADEIDWQEIESNREDVVDKKYGFIYWTKINLEEVYIRVDHISRIWPRETSSGEVKQVTDQRDPIYYRQRTGANVSLGMDMSGGVR